MHIYVLNIIFKNWNDYNHILILFVKILFDCSHVISWVLEREEIMQCIYQFINHILNLKANRNQPLRNYFQKPQRIFVHKIPSQTQIIFIKPNNPNFTKCENISFATKNVNTNQTSCNRTKSSQFFGNLILKMDDRESKISGREYFKSIFIILESTI